MAVARVKEWFRELRRPSRDTELLLQQPKETILGMAREILGTDEAMHEASAQKVRVAAARFSATAFHITPDFQVANEAFRKKLDMSTSSEAVRAAFRDLDFRVSADDTMVRSDFVMDGGVSYYYWYALSSTRVRTRRDDKVSVAMMLVVSDFDLARPPYPFVGSTFTPLEAEMMAAGLRCKAAEHTVRTFCADARGKSLLPPAAAACAPAPAAALLPAVAASSAAGPSRWAALPGAGGAEAVARLREG